MFKNLSWFRRPIKTLSLQAQEQAREDFCQGCNTHGALGQFEDLAVRLAGMQNSPHPKVDPARIVVFVADHGVARESVSSYAKVDSHLLLRNCLTGQSAIARMAQQLDATLEVVDVGLTTPFEPKANESVHEFVSQPVGPGTADYRFAPAMDHEQVFGALQVGRDAVERAVKKGSWLFIGGEIGVGGTLSAGAVVSALMGVSPELLTGSGKSGLPPEDWIKKQAAIQQGLETHIAFHNTAYESLRRLGGFEMAALVGAYTSCGQMGLPAVVDGFCATTAALVAISIHPPLKDWLIFGHRSAEPGQLPLLQTLSVQPVLDMNLRWGEATGAAAVLPMLRLACGFLHESPLKKYDNPN